MASVNRVVIVGNLTRDPEMRATHSGSSLAKMRVAVNDRIKRGDNWEDYANFFDVVVFGKQAENCVEWLAKGKQVGVDGRLRWSEWENNEGQRRTKVEIVAEHVVFLSPRDGNSRRSGGSAVGSGESPAEGDFFEQDDNFQF